MRQSTHLTARRLVQWSMSSFQTNLTEIGAFLWNCEVALLIGAAKQSRILHVLCMLQQSHILHIVRILQQLRILNILRMLQQLHTLYILCMLQQSHILNLLCMLPQLHTLNILCMLQQSLRILHVFRKVQVAHTLCTPQLRILNILHKLQPLRKLMYCACCNRCADFMSSAWCNSCSHLVIFHNPRCSNRCCPKVVDRQTALQQRRVHKKMCS